MDLEHIKPSEIIRQRKTNTVWYILYVDSKKYNKLVNKTKKKEAHRYKEQTSGYQLGEGIEEGQNRGRWLTGTNYLGLK